MQSLLQYTFLPHPFAQHGVGHAELFGRSIFAQLGATEVVDGGELLAGSEGTTGAFGFEVRQRRGGHNGWISMRLGFAEETVGLEEVG